MTGATLTAFRLVTLVSAMLALSFASVPLYDWFCRVTGYGGTTQAADAAPKMDEVLDKTIKVRFDGSLTDDLLTTDVPVELVSLEDVSAWLVRSGVAAGEYAAVVVRCASIHGDMIASCVGDRSAG